MMSKDEKVMVAVLRDPQSAMSVVEGSFRGERRIIVAMTVQNEQTRQAEIGPPLAVMLTEEDYRFISKNPNDTSTGMGPAAEAEIRKILASVKDKSMTAKAAFMAIEVALGKPEEKKPEEKKGLIKLLGGWRD